MIQGIYDLGLLFWSSKMEINIKSRLKFYCQFGYLHGIRYLGNEFKRLTRYSYFLQYFPDRFFSIYIENWYQLLNKQNILVNSIVAVLHPNVVFRPRFNQTLFSRISWHQHRYSLFKVEKYVSSGFYLFVTRFNLRICWGK